MCLHVSSDVEKNKKKNHPNETLCGFLELDTWILNIKPNSN